MGEHVFIKVRPKKISLKLRSCAKLAPRYCGPFEILSRMGQVAYQLALLPNLKVHNVFHISVLKKMYITLLILWTRVMCRWKPKDIFWWKGIVSSKGGRSCSRIAPLVRWRCNGSTLVQKNPPGNWRVICRKHIQFCSRKTLRIMNKITSRMMLYFRGACVTYPNFVIFFYLLGDIMF